MNSEQLRRILSRQGYKVMAGAANPPCELWRGPEGRTVCLDAEENRILTKADVEAKARANCEPDTRDYYLSVVHNWD